MKFSLRMSRRQETQLVILVTLLVVSVLFASPAAAQSDGFGVGRGDGLEVGINLAVLDAIRAEVAAGVYDRACTDAEHNPNKWHSLVNTDAGCHYDHHHGDDPNYVNDIFGTPGGWFNSPGQSISYPWQTFPAQTRDESNAAYLGTGRMENEAKHEAYYWVVRRDQPCNTGNGLFCVKDFRVQFHGMMVGAGAGTRWHSMSAEVRACENVNDESTCGIVRTGGWMDHGRLFVPELVNGRALCGDEHPNILSTHLPLAVDTQFYPLQSNSVLHDEERCHPLLSPEMIENGPSTGRNDGGPQAEWWVHGGSDFRFQLQVADPIGNIYMGDNGQLDNHLFCSVEDANCDWNQSITTMRIQYLLPVNSYYVQNFFNDRFIALPLSAGRYITRFGAINDACTAAGLDCIPIEYNNLRTNVAPGQGLAGFSHTPCRECEKVDYDLSPEGQQWITWFYRKFAGYTPPAEEPPVEEPPVEEPPTGPAVYFQVDNSVAGEASVELMLIDVTDVYGVQAECAVNPAVLQGVLMVQGDGFNDSNSFIIDEGFQADGTWRVAASRLSPNPAITGSATAFMLNYSLIAEGDPNLQCTALAVDANGNNIPLDVFNGTVFVPPTPEPPVEEPPVVETEEPPVVLTGAVSGTVVYQNRVDNAGIQISLLDVDNTPLMTVDTVADGAFSFADLAVGDYNLLLEAPQHIPVLLPVMIANPDEVVKLQAELRAGDVDDNGVIDLLDVTLIGANFGLQTIAEIDNVDLNDDGWVDIRDLTLAGGNLDLAAPTVP